MPDVEFTALSGRRRRIAAAPTPRSTGVYGCGSIGWTSGEPAQFPPYATVGPAKSLVSFQAGVAFGADMAYLLELVARGELRVDVGWHGSWNRFDEAAAALLGRTVAGKALLDHD